MTARVELVRVELPRCRLYQLSMDTVVGLVAKYRRGDLDDAYYNYTTMFALATTGRGDWEAAQRLVLGTTTRTIGH